mgnify:CR=1 FL=1
MQHGGRRLAKEPQRAANRALKDSKDETRGKLSQHRSATCGSCGGKRTRHWRQSQRQPEARRVQSSFCLGCNLT